jgi:hypothetical protein
MTKDIPELQLKVAIRDTLVLADDTRSSTKGVFVDYNSCSETIRLPLATVTDITAKNCSSN